MSVQSLLNQFATIYPKTGYNKYGRDVSSASPVSASCRFENKTRTRLGKDGQVIRIIGYVYLPGDAVINTEDRIAIGGVSYKVFSVDGSVDQYGAQKVIKCAVEKWQTT